jgi:Protein of unknown function (DUF2510)
MTAASPPPGWYPDPWGEAAYRWWNGSSWAPPASPLPQPRHRGRSLLGVGFLVTAAVLFSWAALWLAILPSLVINDADNGRAGHDLRTLWVPEFLPAVITAIVCLALVRVDRRRPLGVGLVALAVLLLAATTVLAAIAFALYPR